METYLPKEIREGLDAACRKDARRKSRLRVHVGDETFPVLRLWHDGFALAIEDAPHLRGLIDLYDGGRHLSQCLIVASEEENGEMVYEFKRATAAADAPPLDFAREDDAPVALIGRESA